MTLELVRNEGAKRSRQKVESVGQNLVIRHADPVWAHVVSQRRGTDVHSSHELDTSCLEKLVGLGCNHSDGRLRLKFQISHQR
jgi:hypothetical protein